MMERRFCPCGWSTRQPNDMEMQEAFRDHHESGHHGSIAKVNALRNGMAAVDAIFERRIEEVDSE